MNFAWCRSQRRQSLHLAALLHNLTGVAHYVLLLEVCGTLPCMHAVAWMLCDAITAIVQFRSAIALVLASCKHHDPSGGDALPVVCAAPCRMGLSCARKGCNYFST